MNGPKGMVEPFSFFLPHATSMRETTAPVKKAMYKAKIIFGNPKINPIRNANFTSPNPIPRPFVIKNKNRKNKHAPRAARRWGSIK